MFFLDTSITGPFGEQIKEYQQLCSRLVFDLERDKNLCRYLIRRKMFILHFKGKTFLYNNVRLSYFTIVCNSHEYKKMDPGFGHGLYGVQNEINISEKHWLGLFIYYDTFINCKENNVLQLCSQNFLSS
jgi:hypothetical protein